jgi:ribonuclease BN (tRNA processing enzyme)
MNRRELLRLVIGGATAAFVVPGARAASSGTRLVFLGTAGGPRPKTIASAPAQVLIVNGTPYVVDCGNGVARQLVLAGVALPTLRHVFITHHHSDHNADYGTLLLLAWGSGLQTPVDTWGPPPLATITRLFLEMSASDIETRMADEGRVPLAPLIRPHELTQAGQVLQDPNVKVTCTLVNHPLVVPALAYRFDTAERSIVFSGDTARSDNLVALAKGADVLVHEALFVPAVDRIVAGDRNTSSLRKHLLDSHTSIEDCGKIATAAGVKTLVITHRVPTDDPAITEQMWIDAARAHFRGTVLIARDLMEL